MTTHVIQKDGKLASSSKQYTFEKLSAIKSDRQLSSLITSKELEDGITINDAGTDCRGSGGVGHVAVQIAKAHGAKVFATASTAKHDMVRQLGAVPIDYHTMAIEEIVQTFTDGRGFDVVYDSVGGSTLDDAFKAVRNYGHVVSNYGWGTHALMPLSRKGATYSGVFVLLPLLTGEGRTHHGEMLRQATQLAESGQLHPIVDSRHFTLDTALAAHEAVDQGTAVSKIVIDVESA